MIKKYILANSIEELNLKSLGLYHDHCYHLYRGKMKDLPNEFNSFKNSNYKYILIYEE